MNTKGMLSAAVAAAFATGAWAEDLQVPVQTVEGWNIQRDLDRGGCIMEKVNEDGYLIRIGKTEAGAEFGFVGVYTKDEDVNVIGGVSRDVTFDLDGELFYGTATGDYQEGYKGGYAEANNPAFGDALARKYVLTINPDGDNPIKLSLDGTFKAMAATRDCEAHSLAVEQLTDNAKRAALDVAAIDAWRRLMADSKRAVEYSEQAKSALIFPEITKAGLGIGGEGGNGVLANREVINGHYRTTSLSFGAQAGVQTYGYVVMFMTDEALQKFLDSRGYELGVDGSIAIFEAGATAEADTTNLKVDTVAFVFDEKGLMANWTVEGTRIRPLEFE
ncbi:MAG: hypothetical protein GJ676_10215 [Rhodobacteraceae bacterium]|nr:hypothetical protein [Paracoccaceae bacterium]